MAPEVDVYKSVSEDGHERTAIVGNVPVAAADDVVVDEV